MRLLKFLEESDIIAPSALRREHMMLYLQFRNKVRRSTALQEIKLLAMVIDEAIARGYVRDNPCRKLGIAKEEVRHKTVWTPRQVEIALEAAEEFDRFGWLHVALLLGRYQAIRLMQCRIPLECIDLSRGMIHYPAAIVKGGKGYSQLIDGALVPVLPEIMQYRASLGSRVLCSIPPVPSVLIRRFLDSLAHVDPGFESLSIHGLRATWITDAALAGVSETLAMRFTNHASREVHAIYQRITADDLRPMLDALALARSKQAMSQGMG
jgi:integrase